VTVIKLNVFGGIMPSVEPRNLPSEGAQTALNMDLRYGDFRPVRNVGASVATVSNGTKTIFRTPGGTWLSSINDVNYVNGQVFDESVTSERVYLTGQSAYPEAWQSGTFRRLGVPAPLVAPVIVVNPVAQFGTLEFGVALQAVVDAVVAGVVANRSAAYLGGNNPTDGGTFGGLWLAHGADSELATLNDGYVAYTVPAAVAGPVVTITAATDQYLTDASLGGKAITYLAATYWSVAMAWRALGYTIGIAGLSTAIKAIRKPPQNVDQLFPDATADAIATKLAAMFDAGLSPVVQMVTAIQAAQTLVTGQVLRTDNNANRASALLAAMRGLDTAVKALEAYFANLNATMTAVVGGLLNSYRYLVPGAQTTTTETRVYIYTYVTDWGEESAPSPPSALVELDENDTCGVSTLACPVVAPYGAVTRWRLYRSASTNTGAQYQFVAEIPIATLDYLDVKRQEELEETCPSLTWVEPVANMIGLVGLPNGIMAGFFGKTLCFAEPYQPYAWPAEYQLTVEFNIVGLGVFGQTLVVLTEGNPYYASGADSASMSAQKLESAQACVSKRSIASAEGAVMFASPDGICSASASGVELLTLGAYAKYDWAALGVTSSYAAFSEGVYYIVVGT
jgi:hypothetical protein